MSRLIINFAAFQAGWFSCVLGAANGYPLVGPAVVLIGAMLHLKLAERPGREMTLLLAAALAGAIFDSALVRTGWLVFPNGMLVPDTAPYWIVALWVAFATTLNVSMRWLRDRPLVAVAFGAIGGPLSYLAGARLGGLEFIRPEAALVALAIGWGLMTPLLVGLARRLDGMSASPGVVQRA